jgi:hypothetical protein
MRKFWIIILFVICASTVYAGDNNNQNNSDNAVNNYDNDTLNYTRNDNWIDVRNQNLVEGSKASAVLNDYEKTYNNNNNNNTNWNSLRNEQTQDQQQGQGQEQRLYNSVQNAGNTNQTAGNIAINYSSPQPLMGAPGMQRYQLLNAPNPGRVWNCSWEGLPPALDSQTLSEYKNVKVRVLDFAPFGKFVFLPAKSVKRLESLEGQDVVSLGQLTLLGTSSTTPAKLTGKAMFETLKRGGNALFVLDYGIQYESVSWSKNKGWFSIPVSVGHTNASGFGTAATFGPSGQTGYAKRLGIPFLTVQVLRAADGIVSKAKARAKETLAQQQKSAPRGETSIVAETRKRFQELKRQLQVERQLAE